MLRVAGIGNIQYKLELMSYVDISVSSRQRKQSSLRRLPRWRVGTLAKVTTSLEGHENILFCKKLLH